MHILLALRLFSLAAVATPIQQADALLSFVTFPKLTLLDRQVTMDEAGYIWITGIWSDGKNYLFRLDLKGKKTLNMILLPIDFSMERDIVFDKWNNAYIPSCIHADEGSYYFSLTRVTSKGQVQDYSLLFQNSRMSPSSYIGITPGDTLFIAGGDSGYNNNIIVKAIITSDGITPIDADKYSRESKSITALNNTPPETFNYVDWQTASGIDVFVCENELRIFQLFLTPEANYNAELVGKYPWRNFIWRTYKDAWIKRIYLTKDNEKGYDLYIPDPSDQSMTHVVRLDNDAVPIDPSTLESGGARNTLAFTLLPKGSKSYVDLLQWGVLYPDSARAQFWGTDGNGNLYLYKKTKRK